MIRSDPQIEVLVQRMTMVSIFLYFLEKSQITVALLFIILPVSVAELDRHPLACVIRARYYRPVYRATAVVRDCLADDGVDNIFYYILV